MTLGRRETLGGWSAFAAGLVLAAAPARADEPAAAKEQTAKEAQRKPAAEAKTADEKPKGAEDDVRRRRAEALRALLSGRPAAPAAAVRAVAKPAEANPDAEEALKAQFAQQFASVVATELAFTRAACDVPKEARPKVRAAATDGLNAAAAKAAELQREQMQAAQAPIAGIRRAALHPKDWPHPRRSVVEHISGALKENLSAEQFDAYTREVAARDAARKSAAIGCTAARIDNILRLGAEQRTKLVEALRRDWQTGWETWTMIEYYDQRYVPDVPEAVFEGVLTPEQKEVWNGCQKINFGYWNGQRGAPPIDEDWWAGGESKPAAPAQPANRAAPFQVIIRNLLR